MKIKAIQHSTCDLAYTHVIIDGALSEIDAIAAAAMRDPEAFVFSVYRVSNVATGHVMINYNYHLTDDGAREIVDAYLRGEV